MGKIGFVGLGIMGRPMAINLLKAGVSLMVNDVVPSAVDAVTAHGAVSAPLAEIGAQCDITITILPSGEIVRDVLFGEGGVASGLSSGKLVCDMSSVTPEDSRFCFDELKRSGVGFVDAPVSGGEPGAVAGTLAIMCGGTEADYERMLPLFEILGSSSMLIGGPGSGSVAKLANQIIVNLNIAAVCEALVLASKSGVDPMKVYHAIRGGLAGSSVLDAKAPMICHRDFKPGGKISINHKDIKNVLAAAHKADVPLPLTAGLFEIQQAAKVAGLFDEDHCAYVKFFENIADTVVRSDWTPER